MKAKEQCRRTNAKKAKATTDKVNYQSILLRDGYLCHICNKPIDPDAKPRSRESLVFDHVIPIQPRPGEPQGTHSFDNIRPAHLVCNIRKSNKRMEDLTSSDRRGL